MRPSSPPRTSTPVPRSSLLDPAAPASGSVTATNRGRCATACAASILPSRVRAQAPGPEPRPAVVLDHAQRTPADRARRAEDHDMSGWPIRLHTVGSYSMIVAAFGRRGTPGGRGDPGGRGTVRAIDDAGPVGASPSRSSSIRDSRRAGQAGRSGDARLAADASRCPGAGTIRRGDCSFRGRRRLSMMNGRGGGRSSACSGGFHALSSASARDCTDATGDWAGFPGRDRLLAAGGAQAGPGRLAVLPGTIGRGEGDGRTEGRRIRRRTGRGRRADGSGWPAPSPGRRETAQDRDACRREG